MAYNTRNNENKIKLKIYKIKEVNLSKIANNIGIDRNEFKILLKEEIFKTCILKYILHVT